MNGREIKTTFPSGSLTLEGIIYIPEGGGSLPSVVVCHPHPLYGGSMENAIVESVSLHLLMVGIVSLRFNFRGVGHSQGEHNGGPGEQADVRAAIDYLATLREVSPNHLGLAGYSAGAGYGLPVGAKDSRIKALAGISPPISMFDFSCLSGCMKPKLLVCGNLDTFVSSKRFHELCHQLSEPKECEVIEGADHFRHGYESHVGEAVAIFLKRALSTDS